MFDVWSGYFFMLKITFKDQSSLYFFFFVYWKRISKILAFCQKNLIRLLFIFSSLCFNPILFCLLTNKRESVHGSLIQFQVGTRNNKKACFTRFSKKDQPRMKTIFFTSRRRQDDSIVNRKQFNKDLELYAYLRILVSDAEYRKEWNIEHTGISVNIRNEKSFLDNIGSWI